MSVKVELHKQGIDELLNEPKVKEAVDEHTKRLIDCANAYVPVLEELTYDKWRETRIEYCERLGDASKLFNIETYLTFDELIRLCRSLLGVGA